MAILKNYHMKDDEPPQKTPSKKAKTTKSSKRVIRGAKPEKTVQIGKVNYHKTEVPTGSDSVYDMPRKKQPDYFPEPFDDVARDEELKSRFKDVEEEVGRHRQTLLSELEEEKKQILDQAHSEGFEQGKKEAEEALQEKSEDLINTINSIYETKERTLREAKGDIIELAIKAAEKVVLQEVTVNQAVILNIVSEAISKVTDKDQLIIRVSHDDLPTIKAKESDLVNQLGSVAHFSIQEDATIDPGGCIVETKMGYVGATIPTKLDSILKALKRTLEDDV